MKKPLETLHDHHSGRHQNQHRIHQRRQLGAAPEAIGEAGRGRPGAQPLSTPAEQQPGHITDVVYGVTDQRQRAEGHTDHQLQA